MRSSCLAVTSSITGSSFVLPDDVLDLPAASSLDFAPSAPCTRHVGVNTRKATRRIDKVPSLAVVLACCCWQHLLLFHHHHQRHGAAVEPSFAVDIAVLTALAIFDFRTPRARSSNIGLQTLMPIPIIPIAPVLCIILSAAVLLLLLLLLSLREHHLHRQNFVGRYLLSGHDNISLRVGSIRWTTTISNIFFFL